MPNNVVFFAVQADDLSRARGFYEKAFGWKFEPWGPPGFYMITTGTKENRGIRGALQKRHELFDGKTPVTYECSIGVADIDATEAAVKANGGKVVMAKCEIPTVGKLIKFLDPEGNNVCAIQYDKDYVG